MSGRCRHLAATIHERVRSCELPFPQSSAGAFVTVSIGIATAIPYRGEPVLDLVHDADVALYRAKADGRDRTAQAARLAEFLR